MKRFIGKTIFALLVAACPAAATAGDIANLDIIGFSDDARYFAFEEYGVQDGSAFPYSNVFVVDLHKDEFVAGFPIRMRIDDESAGLQQVRAMSAAKAAHVVEKDGFLNDPGVLLASNPLTEASADPHSISFYPYPVFPLIGKRSTLALSELPFAHVPEQCLDFGGPIPGFSLGLTEIDGQPANVFLHSEGKVPKSRGCPSGYRIGAVVASMKDPSVRVALILVLTHGFEDADGRFIAVPLDPATRP